VTRSTWIALGAVVGLLAAGLLVFGLIKLVAHIRALALVEQRRRESARKAARRDEKAAITPQMLADWNETDSEDWQELDVDRQARVRCRLKKIARSEDHGVTGMRLDVAVLQRNSIVRLGELFEGMTEEGAHGAQSRLDLAVREAARAVLVRTEAAPGAEWLRLVFFPITPADIGGPTRGSYLSWPPLRFALTARHLAAPVEQSDEAQIALRVEHALGQWYREEVRRLG
jgi:hypothetical protein